MKKYSICFFALYFFCFALMLLTYPKDSGSTLSAETAAVEADAEADGSRMTENGYFALLDGDSILFYRVVQENTFRSVPLSETNLTDEEREKLLGGIYFAQPEDFYCYLESITS